jgi:thymidylate synthase (FAD)
MASFQQESQRYVKYDEDNIDALFHIPPEIASDESAKEIFLEAMESSLRAYRALRALEVKAQFARYVLPNATRTRIIMKANLREWRHVLLLRMHSSAQPEIQKIANLIWSQLNPHFPEIFGDIPGIVEGGSRAIR